MTPFNKIAPDMTLDALRAVLVDVFPELTDAQFGLLAMGWDSVAVDVDDVWIFKFPREADAQKALVREAGLLRVIRPAVTMTVPDLVLFEPASTVFTARQDQGRASADHRI